MSLFAHVASLDGEVVRFDVEAGLCVPGVDAVVVGRGRFAVGIDRDVVELGPFLR